MRAVRALLAALALTACAASDRAAEPERPPNMVIVLADDMGWGDVSAYEAGAWVETPNIDALAAQGVRYTAAYAMAPVCGPSRVGFLTGDEPARYGVSWNPDALRTFIPETRLLLTDLARSAGYRTAIVGKWNLANPAEDHADIVRDEMM